MEPWLLAFGLFALAMAASPGPNNVMMTASGANFGFRRSIPHMLGVAFGFPVMLIGVGLGVGSIFVLYPMVRTILQIIGGLYLLTLAWRIAQGGAGAGGNAARPARPLSFLGAAAFQWLNPKAWMIAVGALGTYAPPGEGLAINLVWMGVLFVAAALPSVALWTLMGMGVGRLLSSPSASPRAIQLFNIAMAMLLVASLGVVFV